MHVALDWALDYVIIKGYIVINKIDGLYMNVPHRYALCLQGVLLNVSARRRRA